MYSIVTYFSRFCNIFHVFKLRYCGSMAERLTRNEQVVSSILTSSSTSVTLDPKISTIRLD